MSPWSKRWLFLMLLATTSALHAGTAERAENLALAECRDAGLGQMSAAALRDALAAAGGNACAIRSAAWGESVACQGTRPGTRIFGLPVRELSAEVQQDSGKRTLQIVTDHALSQVEQTVDQTRASAPLTLGLEQDASGVTVISCIALGPALDGGPADDDLDALATTRPDDGSFEDRR